MPRTADETSSDGLVALTKADISSERISRRALLSTLVLGAGFAAAAIVGGASAREQRRKVGPGRAIRGPQALGQGKKQLPNPYGSAVKQINKQKLKASCPGGYVGGNPPKCLFDF
ncbi:hypothetical protein [Hyphomicrobium sp. CS1BSMeth3]|uniref:hypothetical protein n=1 Tax=Hyphomicrobium sp. CS1BSMeth3 TaxID=1892844 RepID=UPI000931E449|nr:hypothetical protein [Hyphomicrobium sp. CS1BSMeth3]